MDDSINSGSENKLPLIVSVVAIALAVLALAFAVKAKNDAKDAATKLGEANATITSLQGEVTSIRGTAAKTSDIQEIQTKVDTFVTDATAQISNITDHVKAHEKILEGIKSSAKAAVTGTTKTPGGATAPVVAGAGEYVIKSGDTPRKIAAANGVTVVELMKANPGLDASKLRIGQKIKLPAKK